MKISVDYYDQTGLSGSNSHVGESDPQSFEALLEDAAEVDDKRGSGAAESSSENYTLPRAGTAPALETGDSSDSGNDTDNDEQIAVFFDRIRAAGGALAFIQNLNMEKIEKLIEEKRLELEEKFGVATLEGDALADATSTIDDMLADFRKQLMDDLEKQSETQGFDQETFLKQLIHSPSIKSSENDEIV